MEHQGVNNLTKEGNEVIHLGTIAMGALQQYPMNQVTVPIEKKSTTGISLSVGENVFLNVCLDHLAPSLVT